SRRKSTNGSLFWRGTYMQEEGGQATKAEVEEDAGDKADLEPAVRLRRRLLSLPRSLRA
ncbi:hypothetical protein JCM10295v2_006918, partial [Rhodotorula toruloides]